MASKKITAHTERAAASIRYKAWALLFLLTVREGQAMRDVAFDRKAAEVAAEADKEYGVQNKFKAAAARAELSITIKTTWAKGSTNEWKYGEVSFDMEEDEDLEANVTIIRGLDSQHRIMPDAAIGVGTVKGMPIVQITGYQAFDSARARWGPSKYAKADALKIRVETNPLIGKTKEKTILGGTWRYGDLDVYQPSVAGKKPYYLNEKGVLYDIDEEDFERLPEAVPRDQSFTMMAPEELNAQFMESGSPRDRWLMMLLDGVVGKTTCLNSEKDASCLYRCVYDSEADKCGPKGFCFKMDDTPPGYDDDDDLFNAPFGKGDHGQMCRTVAGSTKADSDRFHTSMLDNLKDAAMDLVEEMNYAVLEDKRAGVFDKLAASMTNENMKQTVRHWKSASDILSALSSAEPRVEENPDGWTRTRSRLAQPDMTWRHSYRPMDKAEYDKASVAQSWHVKESTRYSFAAKLHSRLVDYLSERPEVITQIAKRESKKTCMLSSETSADKAKLHTFVEYFMRVPGANKDQVPYLPLSEGCRDYLTTYLDGRQDASQAMQDVAAVDRLQSKSGTIDDESVDTESFLQQVGLSHAVSKTTDGKSAEGASGTAAMLLETDEGEPVTLGFIILCIFVCLLCSIIAGALFAGAFGMVRQNDFKTYFACAFLGVLVICGAFACAPIVGGVALAAALALAIGFTLNPNLIQMHASAIPDGTTAAKAELHPAAGLERHGVSISLSKQKAYGGA